MRAPTAALLMLCCLSLFACGNKGDLFLDPEPLDQKDLETVDEFIDDLERGQDATAPDDLPNRREMRAKGRAEAQEPKRDTADDETSDDSSDDPEGSGS